MLVGSNARKVYSICIPNDSGYPIYQASSYGIYEVNRDGIRCIYPEYVSPFTQLTHHEGKLYFPTDSQYYVGALDWMEDSMCVLNPQTGQFDLILLEEFEAPWESEKESNGLNMAG